MMPQTLASYDRDGEIIGWDVNKVNKSLA